MGCHQSKTCCNRKKQVNTQARRQVTAQESGYKAFKDNDKSEQQGAFELKQNYRVDKTTKLLGNGNSAKVFLSESLKNPDFKVAIKVLDKQKMIYNYQTVMKEISARRRLDHPNIVKYYETYNDHRFFYIVQEYVQGQ